MVLNGETLDANLKAPEQVDGVALQVLHTNVAPNDPALLPLLRQHGVQISAKSQQQPFAVQLLLTLLPWALIIGVWIWLSRARKRMMVAGGPLAA